MNTSDAIILARLSGLEHEQAEEALALTVNNFENLNVTDIINKMANVDSKFAVSIKDLAEALICIGATTQDIRISFSQLIALITTLQQKTARGGAIIGNGLKSILVRLKKPETINQLENTGISVRDLLGEILPAISILESLGSKLDNLTDSQKLFVTELVGGVFQINIIKILMEDIRLKNSVYKESLKVAEDNTNAAINRNAALNSYLNLQPLGKVFNKLTEFDKSLQSPNARITYFR